MLVSAVGRQMVSARLARIVVFWVRKLSIAAVMEVYVKLTKRSPPQRQLPLIFINECPFYEYADRTTDECGVCVYISYQRPNNIYENYEKAYEISHHNKQPIR